jgi:uroporphyrinogen-III decarboxylase
MAAFTSRQRLLKTINREQVDHLPCCFMSFAILRKRCKDDIYAIARAELEMGLDPMLFIPGAPRAQRLDHPDLRGLAVRPYPDVKVIEWREKDPGDFDLLHKEIHTPAGKLTTAIRLSEDWPHGDHIPFIDDYQIPRAVKPLITTPVDLESLRYLLRTPSQDDIAQYKREAEEAKSFARETGVLLAGGWGIGMDMANWLCGMQNLMFLMMDKPEFVSDLLEMIHQWNVERMKVVLSAPVDVYLRRGWYEGCDFITPGFYRQHILPRLKREVDLAHEHDTRFGYITSSGTKPLLDDYLEAGIDVLIGLDPIQGTHTDMPLMKRKLGDKICLWGGVSGAVTVERGNEEEVREAVRYAIKTLGPKGYILSPVDNLTVDEPLTWENISIFIDEWQRHW